MTTIFKSFQDLDYDLKDQEGFDSMLADAVKKARIAVKNGDPTAIDPAKLQVRIEQFKNNLKA